MFEYLQNELPHLKERLNSYESLCERKNVSAKKILLREGEISRQAFFIEKGCVRIWFNNNGIDTTFQFAFENRFVSSAESFRNNTPSLFTIETIEPSVIQSISKKEYTRIMNEMNGEPSFLNLIITSLFERQLYYMKEFLSFVRDTPMQRYMNLLNEKPHIVKRVPQHYIASYLGISSVHLSRIRNKIIRENKSKRLV
ncbi:MAG: Crp/Fnr family transcriptional regulator [Chitinophagaceae bacterium]